MEDFGSDELELAEFEDIFKIPSVGLVKFDLECK